MNVDVLTRIERATRGAEHWEGCESEHLLCAAHREIKTLRQRLDALEQRRRQSRDGRSDAR
jgi:hypothetical protein